MQAVPFDQQQNHIAQSESEDIRVENSETANNELDLPF